MIFYHIQLHSFPKIKFAVTSCTDKYKNVISHREGQIELGLHEGADLRIINKSGTELHPSGNFGLILPDIECQAEAVQKNVPTFITSVSVTGDFSFCRYETENIREALKITERTQEGFFLPRTMPLDTAYTEIERTFRLLIAEYLKETSMGHMRAVSYWCEIIAEVSTLFLESLKENETFNYGEYYSRKVKRYIEENYSEKISVSTIAASLRITPNYLSKVFKQSTGKTITEFLVLTRLYHARRLSYTGNLSAEEIARKVGVCDAHYLNRLFNRYYGTSLHACRQIDREISLYHKKPWDVENLSEDILDK